MNTLRSTMLLFLGVTLASCVPPTNTTANQPAPQTTQPTPNTSSEAPPVNTTQTSTPSSACTFAITLPEDVSVMSSSVTENKASYQLIEPDAGLLPEVEVQLESQGWTRTETISKTAGSSETVFTCAGGGTLRVKFGPVGKSRIYALRLTLE